jgi:hypothetical protein
MTLREGGESRGHVWVLPLATYRFKFPLSENFTSYYKPTVPR